MNRSTILAALLLTLAAGACGSGSDPAGPVMKGDLSGVVVIRDDNFEQLPDFGGVTVSAEGTSLTATTNSRGQWTIHDLPAGTYRITFTKTGIVPDTQRGVQIVGGGEAYLHDESEPLQMQMIPPFSVSDLSVEWLDSLKVPGDSAVQRLRHIALTSTVSSGAPDGKNRWVTYVISASSPAGALGSIPLYFKHTSFIGPAIRDTLRISASELYRSIQPGTVMHIVAFPGHEQVTLRYDYVKEALTPTGVTPPSNEVSLVLQ